MAARQGITMVTASRIAMAAPGGAGALIAGRWYCYHIGQQLSSSISCSNPVCAGMVLIPMVMNKLETGGLFKRFPRAPAPVQVAVVPSALSCTALFPV